MELRGSKTEKNLWEAFAGESQARNKYTYFASKAKKEGYEQISAIFTETANNEKEHAKIWFKLLMENGEIPDTLTCLKMAAAGENEEHTSMYPRMAAEAKAEGFTQIAALFTMVAAIEKDHEERYKALAANIEAGKVYARETEQVWQCRNCGFVYIGQHAPVKCPVCAHPQSYFELKSSNYYFVKKRQPQSFRAHFLYAPTCRDRCLALPRELCGCRCVMCKFPLLAGS